MLIMGHSLIKSRMKAKKALLAGEMSGHIFFADRYFGYDDAIYATCRLLEILSNTSEPLSHYLDKVPKTYNTPEIRIHCSDKIKFNLVEMVKNEFRKKYKIIDIDGVRIIFPDGWGLLRASNTSPMLVLRFEADSQERLYEIQNLVEETLQIMREKISKDKQ